MVICPYCQKEIAGELDTCPHCGVTMIYFYQCHRCHQEIAATGILKFCPLCDANFSDQMN
ncbi:zinc ribbon domain-containing protein [Desulforamulus aeronauticus]|uniref:Double zinc ribbon n=1 Tax=Desulforamulus aeronauticus DSM 10349 TaxID=1121421 RepID=A0A1M6PWT1_9FIRM|nr:zinc ribbon domain-containing protein [Desulforamulus aeronauticus]SHK12377.1 hypothetical protein SAMN02745123_00760 [Desulforamulus aeronauticus DSM 10349]